MRHGAQTVMPNLYAPIDFDRYRGTFGYLSVRYIVLWRSFGYRRLGKNHSHSMVNRSGKYLKFL
jgi:hypothetical protein